MTEVEEIRTPSACLYVCAYVYLYVYVCLFIDVFVFTYMHILTDARMYSHVCV